jgi:peptidoglycan/LPS O-acetylase OafA/YrhL
MTRLPGLDVLRALAIVWVIFFHAGTLSLGSPWPAVTSFGWMGVDLFFVLSGFLIGRQWLARQHFRDFYLRRALRILPAYLVVVAVYFGVPATQERAEIQPLWQFLTFTENLFIDFFHGKTFSHVWSLCVEEHFYFLFPLLAWVLLRRPSAVITSAVFAAILLGGIALRAHEWFDVVAPLADVEGPGNMGQRFYEHVYYPTWTRLDGLLVGVVLAVIETHRPRAWALVMKHPPAVFGAGLLFFVAAIALFQEQVSGPAAIIGYPVLAIAMGCFVVVAASPTGGRLKIPGAAFIAAISYSLYLTHKMALFLLRTWAGETLGRHGVAAIAAYSAITLLFGVALHYAVERPFLALRNRMGDLSPAPRGRG